MSERPYPAAVERQTWVQVGMVLTILLLLVLILLTPSLIGRPQELASIPLLIVGLSTDEGTLVLDLGAAVQAYLYRTIILEIVSSPDPVVNRSVTEEDAYHVGARVPANDTLAYAVRAWFMDRQDNYFEYNVTVNTYVDADDRRVLAFGLVDEDTPSTILVYPPGDFRWVVPPRGSA